MHIPSKRGFTLMEIILVITVIGILVSALFPSVTSYQRRGRDATRLSHINSLAKVINNYFLDKEDYPNSVAGCVDSTALWKYGPVQTDPSTTNDNGCGVNQKYAYWSSALLVQSTDEFVILAKMENINGWNTGSINSLTWSINQAAYTTLRANMTKWVWQYYAITK